VNAAQQAKVFEARAVLHELGFPAQQSNERSALCLLCLIDLRPDLRWADADGSTLWSTHELMQWLRDHYGRDYAANTRETIRRQTLHQFVEAGLALYNPDDASRAVNSPANCYQIAPVALRLLRRHDDDDFEAHLAAYRESRPGLKARYAATRGMAQIPVMLGDGARITLSAGGQNVLIKAIVEEFCGRWTPAGRVLYIGDAGKQEPLFDADGFAALGVTLDPHGKLPDLVVHMTDRNWLVLIEAASSHGPVDGKRHAELKGLFARCTAGLVYVSCFPTRAEMRKYLADIAWSTEVWCADNPEHLIHFDGERFLGPYD
jgi:hypothetical protein